MQTYLPLFCIIDGKELLFFKQSLKHGFYPYYISTCTELDLFQN